MEDSYGYCYGYFSLLAMSKWSKDVVLRGDIGFTENGMTLGQKIIQQQFHLISWDEADEIYDSLTRLERHGVWVIPGWSRELAHHYGTAEAATCVTRAGWRTLALVYRYALTTRWQD